jgi:hypothetical protein
MYSVTFRCGIAVFLQSEIQRFARKTFGFLKKVYPESVSRTFRNPKPLILLSVPGIGG